MTEINDDNLALIELARKITNKQIDSGNQRPFKFVEALAGLGASKAGLEQSISSQYPKGSARGASAKLKIHPTTFTTYITGNGCLSKELLTKVGE